MAFRARSVFERARLRGAAIAAALAAIAMPVLAQSRDPAFFVQSGDGDRAVRSVAWGGSFDLRPLDPESPDPWSFYVEGTLGEWFSHHHDAGQQTRFAQFTVAPAVRYTFGGALRAVFAEAGIGLSAIAPHFEDHNRRFSTIFNFDDHVALGVRLGEHDENEISVRGEHFSNGGVKNPNPGQNFVQLRIARHF
jgi:hypothetical protein